MRPAYRIALSLGACISLFFLSTFSATAEHKRTQLAVDKVAGSLSVMVLGSGGPVATPSGRASAGYLIFVEGQPRILMDIGGGGFQRLAASGTNVKDLDIVLLSHLHIDHTGDLSSVIKTVYFHNRGAGTFRTAPIRIFGPGVNAATFPGTEILQYPASTEYVDGHYHKEFGLERYLNIFATAISGGEFDYTIEDFSPDVSLPTRTILDEDGLLIQTLGVIHGPVPSLAFRIEYQGKSIVYSGDTSSKTDNMIDLAEDADLLIYDTAIMDDLPAGPNDGVFFALHTTPTRIGEVAAAAEPEKLVLSHITPITEPRLDEVKRLIRAQGYEGRIITAEDLQVYNLDRRHKREHDEEDDD
jgi:ribonuclease BN (tRNA processing enzyme)